MKITKTQLKQIIKEELNEISKKQRAHEEQLADQAAQRQKKEQEADELEEILDKQWQVNVRKLEGIYQLTVTKKPARAPGDDGPVHPNILAAYEEAGGVTGTGQYVADWWWGLTPEERDAVETP